MIITFLALLVVSACIMAYCNMQLHKAIEYRIWLSPIKEARYNRINSIALIVLILSVIVLSFEVFEAVGLIQEPDNYSLIAN